LTYTAPARRSFSSESPLMVAVRLSALFNVTEPVAEPDVAVFSPVNVTFVNVPPVDTAGSKLRITPADPVPPAVNGPWICPRLAFAVRPVKVVFQVNTCVDVSSVAVNVPVPVGLPVTLGSFAGESAAVKFTIFDTGGGLVESSDPHAAATTIVAKIESEIPRFSI